MTTPRDPQPLSAEGLRDLVLGARRYRGTLAKVTASDWQVILDAARPSDAGSTVTHGRHCACSACAREDWTNPDLAHCGMHGPSCPRRYDPSAARSTDGLRAALYSAASHAHRAQREAHDAAGLVTDAEQGHPGAFDDCPAPVCAERRAALASPEPERPAS